MNEWIMKGILAALAALVLLVGCQTFDRTVRLPTQPHIKQQDVPALIMEEPERKSDPVIDAILMFRKACLEKKAFWIKHEGEIEQYACERVDVETKAGT